MSEVVAFIHVMAELAIAIAAVLGAWSARHAQRLGEHNAAKLENNPKESAAAVVEELTNGKSPLPKCLYELPKKE